MSIEALGGNAYFIRWQGTKAFETATWLYMMKQSFKDADAIRDALAQNGTWMNDTASLARWSSVDVYI
jgi:cysteinyl-tRNA synthetase